MSIYNCYSAGPGLFPRTLPNGHVETWEEAQTRVRALNETIAKIPKFNVITPTNSDLSIYPESEQARVCMRKDLYLAANCDIVFADMTPFGGREPDSGTLVEAVTCALSGGLLVLWSNPLTTFAQKYADADVHPDSFMDEYYNLMIEQLYYWNWKTHFDFSPPIFGSLEEAVDETAYWVYARGLKRIPLIDKIGDSPEILKTVKSLLI